MSEVIIDGCNVAECEYYQIEANELYPKAQYCGSMRNTFCENEPDCYFKQLQRAKAENEKLKETLNEIKERILLQDKCTDYNCINCDKYTEIGCIDKHKLTNKFEKILELIKDAENES